ncbi:M14 family zinc carboxypeptidase [Halobium salinum]|uniref:M14 family zinc carboxypeptidase n=1 Tax=Halobium salinum TaxID=1364940 RepID=A0ABD5PFX7_9EURY|nr:M14 family zinc carboxypeptidase [Halobium salinum]
MRRRTFLTAAGATAVGLAGASSTAAQEGTPIPNPNAYLTNSQLTRRLKLLNAESDLVSLRPIGRSACRNDPIWEVTVGEGETNVHLITQIHGDEPAGTEAALVVLRQMTAEPDEFEAVLDELTITIVPRVNPDGAMYGFDADGDGDRDRVTRRQNVQPWSKRDSLYEPYYHYASGEDFPYAPENPPLGYDMNRDFNIRTDLDAGDVPEEWWTSAEEDGETVWQVDQPYEGYTLSASGLRLAPEVRAVTESFLRADPDYAITHHHQGIASVPDTEPPEPSLLSVMAAFGPSYLEQAPFYDGEGPVEDAVNPFIDRETSERSLRLNRLVADRLAETTEPWDDAFDDTTRYGYATLWGSYLDALCPQTGAAGMLYEISGQSDAAGSRAYGLKVEASRVGFLETFEALAADPTLSSVDAGSYFDIPLKGEDIETPPPAGRGRSGPSTAPTKAGPASGTARARDATTSFDDRLRRILRAD